MEALKTIIGFQHTGNYLYGLSNTVGVFGSHVYKVQFTPHAYTTAVGSYMNLCWGIREKKYQYKDGKQGI